MGSRQRARSRLRLVSLRRFPCGGAPVVLLKIWAGALLALVLFLCLQAVLQEHSDHIARTQVVKRI